jgi:hypothetical protein
MGLSNRNRDFSSGSLAAITEQLSGPKEAYKDFSSFWGSHGGVFETVDFSGKASTIDEFMSNSRNLISVIAPTKFEEVFAALNDKDAAFSTDCENATVEMKSYALGLDLLIQTIGDSSFPASFDRESLSTSLTSIQQLTVEQSKYVNQICSTYGFTSQIALYILRVYENIYDTYADETEEYKAWLFSRALGGLAYGTGDWYDSFKWSQTAGKPVWRELGYSSELDFFSSLGLTEKEYQLLRSTVRVQHLIHELDDSSWESVATNPEAYRRFKQEMKDLWGRDIGYDGLEREWKNYLAQMGNKSDFAHQNITAATYFADDLGKIGPFADFRTGGQTAFYAGWLGDSVLLVNDGNQKRVAFDDDDWYADIDAQNIHYYMDKYSISYMEAHNLYYGDISSSTNRRDIFIESMTPEGEEPSRQYVQAILIDELRHLENVPPVVPLTPAANMSLEEQDAWIEEYIVGHPQYGDTHRFLQTLGYGGEVVVTDPVTNVETPHDYNDMVK